MQRLFFRTSENNSFQGQKKACFWQKAFIRCYLKRPAEERLGRNLLNLVGKALRGSHGDPGTGPGGLQGLPHSWGRRAQAGKGHCTVRHPYHGMVCRHWKEGRRQIRITAAERLLVIL